MVFLRTRRERNPNSHLAGALSLDSLPPSLANPIDTGGYTTHGVTALQQGLTTTQTTRSTTAAKSWGSNFSREIFVPNKSMVWADSFRQHSRHNKLVCRGLNDMEHPECGTWQLKQAGSRLSSSLKDVLAAEWGKWKPRTPVVQRLESFRQ